MLIPALRQGLRQAGGGAGCGRLSGPGFPLLAALDQQGLCPQPSLFILDSLSVGSCPGLGGQSLLSWPGVVGRTFLSQGEGAVVIKSRCSPEGPRHLQLPFTGLCWTDSAQHGLSQLGVGASEAWPREGQSAHHLPP